jgi:predicted secreted protein
MGVVQAQPVAGTAPPANPFAQPVNQMTLAATASSDVPLDVLAVTLAATREGPEAAMVQSDLTGALEAALAEARPMASPGRLEVRTGAFSLSPRYASAPTRAADGAPVIVGWIGRAELQLEGRDQKAVAQLAGKLNTMRVARVAFSLSREQREAAEAQTTRLAITRFRERAQAYAQQFGFSGYTLREVQVGLQDAPAYMPVRAPMMRAMGAPASADAAIPVEAGQTTVSVTVSGSVQLTR